MHYQSNSTPEIIALGQELNAKLLILDNREPRLFATAANLPLIGTFGVIKLAWKKGLIEYPVAELKKLRSEGCWIDDNLIGKVKNEVNDSRKKERKGVRQEQLNPLERASYRH